MAIHLEYRKTGAQTWLLATFDLVGTHTIEGLDPVEYEIRAYDTTTELYSEIITEIASGGYVDVTVPSSLVTTTKGTGIHITDNAIFPKSGGLPIPYSIEIVIKPTLIENSGYFFNAIDDASGIRINLWHASSGDVRFEVIDNSGNRKSVRTQSLVYMSLNNWYHIIATDDGTNSSDGMNLIINTVEPTLVDASQGTYVGLPDLTGNLVLRLPTTIDNNSLKFIGKHNYVRVYHNKIISLSEAIELWNKMELRPLDGLDFAGTCVLEHRFNNNIFSHIGTDATPVGVLTYDTDLPWKVPVNEVSLYEVSVLGSIFWVQMYKSSDWPEITTTKPYFLIYSSDHAADGGGVAWGECDDVYFNGFVERGVIISGYQGETPWLMRIPTSKSGLSTDTIFLFYHTVMGEPGNDGKQQTRLVTTTGGVLHTASWTDRGRPIVLETEWNHTGYCIVLENSVGDFVAHHATRNLPNSTSAITGSTTGLTFTLIEDTTNRTVGGYTYLTRFAPFERNGVKYAFVILNKDGGRKIAVVTLGSNTLPDSIVDIIEEFYTMNWITAFTEVDTAYIMIKFSSSNDRTKRTYMVEYDLTQLDA